MSVIRRHPWRFALILVLVIALTATAGVLIYKRVYVNTHTAGEWVMDYYDDDPRANALAAEVRLADGLTGVFYVQKWSGQTSLWGAIVEERPLGYEFLERPIARFAQTPHIYPYNGPVQQWNALEYTWHGENYVLDFGAITDPEIEAVYVDGVEESLIDTGDGWRLFYAVLPADGYTGEHSVLPDGIEALNETY